MTRPTGVDQAQAAQYASGARPHLSASGFMAAIPAAPVAGNTPFAHRYAEKVRQLFHRHAANAPRSLQTRLGPSEIGVPCHRQVVGKLAGLPATNHVVDPWPSIRGTALHTWAEQALLADNARQGRVVWLPERKVTPFDVRDHHEGHRGSADALDCDEIAVVDWKFLGETSMNKIRRHGPDRKYRVQLKLYGKGYRNEGVPVVRVVLVAVPATAGSLDGIYVWEHVLTPEDDAEIAYVEAELDWRKRWAAAVAAGAAGLLDVPCDPSDDCYFCPFYRPQAARDGGSGCPGNAPAAA